MIPVRVFKAWRVEDLSNDDLLILVQLAAVADEDREVVATLRGLMELLRWEKSHDQLGRRLAALRKGGWIEYDSKERQKGPYVIRITGGAPMTDAPSDASKGPFSAPLTHQRGVPMRQWSDARASEEEQGNPHGKGDSLTHDLRSASVGASTEEIERKNDVVAREEDDYDEAFEQAIAPLGSATRSLLTEWRTAWIENQAGVRQIIAQSASAKSPAAVVTKLIREGAHRRVVAQPNGAATAESELFKQSMISWIDNEHRVVGVPPMPLSYLKKEVARLKRIRRIELAAEDEKAILDHWQSVHGGRPE